MAGKRLLDAARLINASGPVARHHLTLRRQQWNLYTQTSGVAASIQKQSDRVILTAKAAFELAKRLTEAETPTPDHRPSPTYQESSTRQTSASNSDNAHSGPSAESAHVSSSRAQPPAWTASAPVVKQDAIEPCSDRIPLATTVASPADSRASGQDTYNERERPTTHPSSLSPSASLPTHAQTSDNTDINLSKNDLNPDVFSSLSVPMPVQTEDDFHDVQAGHFSNPQVASKLGYAPKRSGSPYAGRQKLPPQPLPEMVAASKQLERERELARASKDATAAENSQDSVGPNKGDPSTTDLATAIAGDVQATKSSSTPEAEPSQSPATERSEMRESRVPSSRLGRLWQYGSLATGMAFGALGESIRQVAGGSQSKSFMLSENNMNRLVAKLSRMRGAALKLGQMMSFQDSNVLPPSINAVLQRVQDSADYMPSWQRDKVLIKNLGPEWKELFSTFEQKPFAAASIGQVHKATLKSNGKDVAVKVQYPGVRNSIDSDLNNLSLLLTASQLLPKGLYLDKTIANARTELGWECDYEREARACIRFKTELLVDQTTFAVPTVYSEASGPDVLTMEFMEGIAVTKIADLTQQERDWIGTQLLRLSLRELMEWHFMQTDPNWTNFLWNRNTQKIELLDFGASREFPRAFVEPYVALLMAAAKGDREGCCDRSLQLGYLTGQESPAMLQAHVDSILTLAEPFVDAAPEVYDFRGQTITDRVRANIGIMLRERLAPPPEETYSLHRKLSGAFLLCARLQSRVRARDLFKSAVFDWEKRLEAGI